MEQITNNLSICTKDFIDPHELADVADKHPAELLKENKNFTIDKTSDILKENNEYITEQLNAVYDPASQAYLEYRQIIKKRLLPI